MLIRFRAFCVLKARVVSEKTLVEICFERVSGVDLRDIPRRVQALRSREPRQKT